MKTKKIVSVFCAVSMLLSICSFASAAETEPQLSACAGKTIHLHVTHVNFNGELTEDYLNVDIPEGATQKEELELVNSAASSTVSPTTFSARANGIDEIAAWGGHTITTSYKTVGSVFLNRNYSSMRFYFNNATYTGAPTKITIRLAEGNSDGLVCTSSLSSSEVSGEDWISGEVVIVNGLDYNGVPASFLRGDAFDLQCKVNSGSAKFAGIIVMGYY